MERVPAALLALLVGLLGAFPDRLQQRRGVDLVLLVVLDVANVTELEHHEPGVLLALTRRDDGSHFVATHEIVREIQQLHRPRLVREQESLGHPDLGETTEVGRHGSGLPRNGRSGPILRRRVGYVPTFRRTFRARRIRRRRLLRQRGGGIQRRHQ